MAERVLTPVEDRLSSLLRDRFGHDEFRDGQRAIMDAVLEGRDALAIMPTGSGKSLIYQLPAMLLDGLTVVVSPLIALMKDQTDKMEEIGVDARAIDSTLTDRQLNAARAALRDGRGPPALRDPGAIPRPRVLRRAAPAEGLACSWWTRRIACPSGATTSAPTTCRSAPSRSGWATRRCSP